MYGGSRDRLGELVGRGAVCVLSGAGLSTESGIPDYRGPSGALRARLPMTIAEFRSSSAARQRYWARAQIGWQRLAAARPNAGHRAVAALQQAGLLRGIITQNVDGLHQAAGARDIVELHGTLDRVVCLECGARSTRDALDERLRAVNPDLAWNEVARSNPDGDVELADEHVARFRLVGCECCGADLLKPDVVFFGENVPRPRVQRCFELDIFVGRGVAGDTSGNSPGSKWVAWNAIAEHLEYGRRYTARTNQVQRSFENTALKQRALDLVAAT
jgi:NAD-dependent SIR2 family protein deacetylase